MVLLCCSVLPAAAMSGQDAARDRMLSELKGGALGAEPSAEGDASSKRVLIRGCDPVMAERAKGFLPALIGNAQIERWVAIAPAKRASASITSRVCLRHAAQPCLNLPCAGE